MTYFKIISNDGEPSCVYATNPIFIRVQNTNGIVVRCEQKDACGIVGQNGNDIYTLFGKTLGNGFDSENKAVVISYSEYEEILNAQNRVDIEDESPQIPEDVPEETVMTRVELTRRITDLEAQNEFLQDCILEMSEAIYG